MGQASAGLRRALASLLVFLLYSPALAAGGEGQTSKAAFSWEKGLQLTAFEDKLTVRIGGRAHYDFGRIDADHVLHEAFPGLDGTHGSFRRLAVSLQGGVREIVEIRLEVDVSKVEDIKDDWLRFPGVPFLRRFRFGHMKEPFSFAMLESGNTVTFMEVPLAVDAFGPSRNIGALGEWTLLERRATAAAGLFLNTGSFGNDGQAKDRIDNANGANATVRVTGLPWYGEDGRKLFHLGVSYSHRFRDEDEDDPSSQFRARPESRLTDDRLVSTGKISTERQDLLALEGAGVFGPLFLQGEYFHTLAESASAGGLAFRGWYAQAGWVVTGEGKRYDRRKGVFSGVRPRRPFDLPSGGWGALEAALRWSEIDLNDGPLRGGRERNVTAGLNWYLRPGLRLMTNYIVVSVKDRGKPSIDNGRADIAMARFQVNF